MITIPLHPDFASMVANGSKVTTVRYGRRDYPNGAACFAVGDINMPITITGCVYKTFSELTEQETKVRKTFSELTEQDAHNDGFNSLSELTQVLLKFYPHAQSQDTVTIVQFNVNRNHTS